MSTTLLDEDLGHVLVADPHESGIVHAASSRGVYTSTGYGASWELHAFPRSANVQALAVDPSDPDVMYVGTYDAGLLYTRDGGHTWTDTGTDILPLTIWDIAADATTGALYAGTSRGVFQAVAGGDGFRPTGLDVHTIQTLAAAGPVIYAGLSGAGISRSDDGGETWQHASEGLGGAFVAIRSGADSTLYAASDGVFRPIATAAVRSSSAR